MPSATARRLYEDQIPSFMSVYDLDSGLMDQSNTVTIVDPKLVMEDAKALGDSQRGLGPGALTSDTAHRHNGSTSTQTTESADSSPTTTVSCADSSDLSDPSPSSSPDSPVNLAPLQGFAPNPFGGLSGMARLTVSGPNQDRPVTAPAPRRPKNMKGLSIQPPFSSASPSILSEPSSPCFIKPKIPAMKRKPSQLSLKTNSSDLISRTTLEVPCSPALPPILQRRALKHSTSSPQMLSGLKSATFGPPGGMTIPTVLERNESGLSSFFRPARPTVAPGLGSTIDEEDSPIRTQVANRAAYEIEPFHDVENNEDQKSPGYPDGPVAIYGDNVFLYLEPTAEEAARFDVVINVAREVANPFKAASTSQQQDSPIPATTTTPGTAMTDASFTTAFEYFPGEASDNTPTTPKAQACKEPEYIHMLWDHNTDISPDLMTLCETIDKRTKEGKKVLVHCQQGASRSASLIIAYGLYQQPELGVNDAYYAAQKKSRWISPNMKLMYCLQDFQKEVAKRRLSPNSGLKLRSGRSPANHRTTMSADHIGISPKEPLTAPLPADDPASDLLSPQRSANRARGNSTPNRGEPMSAGPSSAPSFFSWSDKEDDSDPGKFGRFNFDSRLPPQRADSGFASSANSLPPPPPSPGLYGFTQSASSVCRPPPSPGLAPLKLSKPPRSPKLAPPPIAKPPPSPGLAPLGISRPPMTPGFPPSNPLSKPPPSPGFGAHRFGTAGGFGFVSLNLGASPQPIESKEAAPDRHVSIMRGFPDDAALLSPRAETMTDNPIHQSLSGLTGMQFVEVPPTPSDGVFSPRETLFPRDPYYPFGRPVQTADPRSPPTKGESPIVRSIDEMI